MSNARLNFARRPFRDQRPILLVAGAGLAAGLLLLVGNVRLYADFHREVAGIRAEIEWFEAKEKRAGEAAEQARQALDSFKVSALAQESAGLAQILEERRFSWTRLLSQLERTLPSGVRLARLAPGFDKNHEVHLDMSLVGRTPESVVETITALSRNPVFEAVELRTEASPEQGVPEGFSFQLGVRYLAPGEGASGSRNLQNPKGGPGGPQRTVIRGPGGPRQTVSEGPGGPPNPQAQAQPQAQPQPQALRPENER